MKVRSNVNTTILDELKISGNSSGPNTESTPAARKLIWGGMTGSAEVPLQRKRIILGDFREIQRLDMLQS